LHIKQGEKILVVAIIDITVQFVTVPEVEGEVESDAE
jgi:hypothetical protein